MTAQRPRKSHYLPKFYLAGFTASGAVEDALYVFDQTALADWPSSPKKAATERDCYVGVRPANRVARAGQRACRGEDTTVVEAGV